MTGKLVAVVVFVLAVWVAVEVGQEGVSGAFGGLFAGFAPAAAEEPSPPRRAAGAVERAWGESTDRVERQLERVESP